MGLMIDIEKRLRFIEKFYNTTSAPFRKTIPQIEVNNSIGLDRENLDAYEEASDSLTVIGNCCLCMTQACLQLYLKTYVDPENSSWWWGHGLLQDRVANKKGKSSFERYRRLFLEDLGIDWEESPVRLSDLEQLNLTRDDLNHNIDPLKFEVERTASHRHRFPAGLFTSEMLLNLELDWVYVDQEKLHTAVGLVREFCYWLEDIRERFLSGLGQGRVDNPSERYRSSLNHD
jgi:hypothetical protein